MFHLATLQVTTFPAGGLSSSRFMNVVVCETPILYVARANRNYGKDAWLKKGAPKRGPDAAWEEYILTFTQEISPEVVNDLRLGGIEISMEAWKAVEEIFPTPPVRLTQGE